MALARQGEKHNESFLRGSINSYGESKICRTCQLLPGSDPPTDKFPAIWIGGSSFPVSAVQDPNMTRYVTSLNHHSTLQSRQKRSSRVKGLLRKLRDSFCYTAIFCLINIYHHKFRAILLVEGVASPLKSVFELLSLHCLIKVIMFFV